MAAWLRDAQQKGVDANKPGEDQIEETKQKMKAVEDDVLLESLELCGPGRLEAHLQMKLSTGGEKRLLGVCRATTQ